MSRMYVHGVIDMHMCLYVYSCVHESVLVYVLYNFVYVCVCMYCMCHVCITRGSDNLNVTQPVY